MNLASTKSHRKTSWKIFLCLLCVAMVLLGSTVQAAHSHAGGDLTHTDCSLCVSAHAVAQIAGSPEPISAALVLASVEDSLPETCPNPFSIFALFTRPPPAVSNLA